MRLRIFVLLYMALAAFANPALAGDLESLKAGDMKKLVIAKNGAEVTGTVSTPDGKEVHLKDLRGKVLVVNFWATWCAPCREEMPSLNALDAALGGDGFDVLAIASGRNQIEQIQAFNADHGIDRLEILLDPRSNVMRAVGAFGLPTTLILGPDGVEIARLQGDADWASQEAIAILEAIISQSGV